MLGTFLKNLTQLDEAFFRIVFVSRWDIFLCVCGGEGTTFIVDARSMCAAMRTAVGCTHAVHSVMRLTVRMMHVAADARYD